MIRQYPNAPQASELRRPDPPASLLRAVKVMYAGALLFAVHAVIYVVTAGAQKSAIARRYPHLTAHHLATLSHITVITGTVLGAIGAIAFVWIARSCLKGRNGARITGTVFLAIAVLGAVYDFTSPLTTLNLTFVVLEVVTGLAAVVLLWQRRSSAYFTFFKRPQF
jgi:hypothetical protein